MDPGTDLWGKEEFPFSSSHKKKKKGDMGENGNLHEIFGPESNKTKGKVIFPETFLISHPNEKF